jgi:hypothetical protein
VPTHLPRSSTGPAVGYQPTPAPAPAPAPASMAR